MAPWTESGAQRRRRRLCALVAVAALVASLTEPAAARGVAQAASSGSDVCASSTCIANGESECDRATADCPPCIYLLSTGSYSCYDLVDGECPYSNTYTVCDSSSSSSSSSSGSSTGASSSSVTSNTTTTAPSSTTTAPSATTAAPTVAVAGDSSSSSGSGVVGTVTPIVRTSPTASSSGSSSSAAASTDSASPTAAPTSSSTSGSDAGSAEAGSATTASAGSNSSDVAMMAALIGAAAVGIVVVAIFIAHRVRKRGLLQREPYRSTFGPDGAMFAIPRDTGKSSGLQFAGRAYSSHLTPTTSNSITVLGGGSETLDGSVVMLADSQVRPQSPRTRSGLLSMSSLSSSTADFSIGPQFRPDASGGVDLAASSASTSSLKTQPASPMTALDASLTRKPVAGPAARAARANFVPSAIVEDREDEEEFSSFEQQSRYVRLASAESVIYSKPPAGAATAAFAPEDSGVSISSTMSSLADDYDIVDPHVIREGERRNTELLVRDSEFPKFSAFSESDLLSEDGCDDAADDDLALSKEHEI